MVIKPVEFAMIQQQNNVAKSQYNAENRSCRLLMAVSGERSIISAGMAVKPECIFHQSLCRSSSSMRWRKPRPSICGIC